MWVCLAYAERIQTACPAYPHLKRALLVTAVSADVVEIVAALAVLAGLLCGRRFTMECASFNHGASRALMTVSGGPGSRCRKTMTRSVFACSHGGRAPDVDGF